MSLMEATHADIRVADVVTDAGTQSRAEISEATVAEYAEKMTAGESFPPIVLFHDGSVYWLADGFHRVMAATRAGQEWVAADVRKGTKRDAILYSVSTNAAHGLPRTSTDKRHAVSLLLNDEEWRQWSDREIARQCCVSAPFVGDVRRGYRTRSAQSSSSVNGLQMESVRKVERNGAVYTQRTENIGQRKPADIRKREIEHLAEQGNNAEQIGRALGLPEDRIRLLARQHQVRLPDTAIGKTRRIDNRRVVEQTVLGLEASAQSLSTIGYSLDGITPDEARDWAESVSKSMRIYRAFHKALNEVANV